MYGGGYITPYTSGACSPLGITPSYNCGGTLTLCYRHIVVTLLRDPEGGPRQILFEFTYEFTKEYLGSKDA